MQIFEYMIFKNEKRDDKDKVTDPAVILVDRTAVLARDEDQAKLIAARAIKDEDMADLDRVVVATRPF